jgi:hypothetical protein
LAHWLAVLTVDLSAELSDLKLAPNWAGQKVDLLAEQWAEQ